MKVDRKNRDRLIDAINRYLAGEITAFEFDEEIFDDITNDTDDLTVNYAIHSLWHFYDDLTDHKVHLSKEGWDYFQRLILILKSDAHIQHEGKRIWSQTQTSAAYALGTFGMAVALLGINYLLIVSYLLLFSKSISLHQKLRNLLPKHPENDIDIRFGRWDANESTTVATLLSKINSFLPIFKPPPGPIGIAPEDSEWHGWVHGNVTSLLRISELNYSDCNVLTFIH